MQTDPRWQRRSADRPAEILDAALAEFSARGFAAARMADIAARAGISKAALFVYFPTKAALFEALITVRAAPQIALVGRLAEAGVPFATLVEALLDRIADTISQPGLRKLARIVIAESGNFPELARQWHDNLVGPALATLSGAITAGQARGEARPGDPHAMALGIIGPFIASLIWKEVMEPAGGAPLDIAAVLAEHKRTLVAGVVAGGPRPVRP
jgi:AcrR family transcriptional regulator